MLLSIELTEPTTLDGTGIVPLHPIVAQARFRSLQACNVPHRHGLRLSQCLCLSQIIDVVQDEIQESAFLV